MKSGLIRIHNKTISDDSPVFIIAEAGVNHNGSLANAKKLIDVAKKCGADCVKFQTYVTDDIVTQTADKAPYQKASGYDETQWEMLKRLELSYEQFSDLMDYANRSEIIFMSTPYGIGDLEFLISINVPAIKIASALVVETHLLKKAASSGLPVILSTGMCSASEVESAVTAFKEENNDQIVVLQCTSNYPSKLENANLKAMKYMRNAFDVLVGYSDHTESSVSAVAAVALGATVIERHLTLDKTMQGPDHSSSCDPGEFAEYVSVIRDTEKALGAASKQISEEELANIKLMRRGVFAKMIIKKGEILTNENLCLKRPLMGLGADKLTNILGKRAVQDIEADTPLEEKHLI